MHNRVLNWELYTEKLIEVERNRKVVSRIKEKKDGGPRFPDEQFRD